MGTFHEVLPGNLDFFHFYYIGTKEIEILNNATAFYVKSYISEWNCTSGIQNLTKTFCDRTVDGQLKKCIGVEVFLGSPLII